MPERQFPGQRQAHQQLLSQRSCRLRVQRLLQDPVYALSGCGVEH